MVIRSATMEDLPQLTKLYVEEIEYQERISAFFQLIPHVNWTSFVRSKLRDRRTEIFVAERNGQLTGYIEAWISGSGLRTRVGQQTAMVRRLFCAERRVVNPYGYIEDIYVKPEFRNQGIASSLIQQVYHWCKHNGLGEIRAAIWTANTASLNLFNKFDFKPIRLIMRRNF